MIWKKKKCKKYWFFLSYLQLFHQIRHFGQYSGQVRRIEFFHFCQHFINNLVFVFQFILTSLGIVQAVRIGGSQLILMMSIVVMEVLSSLKGWCSLVQSRWSSSTSLHFRFLYAVTSATRSSTISIGFREILLNWTKEEILIETVIQDFSSSGFTWWAPWDDHLFRHWRIGKLNFSFFVGRLLLILTRSCTSAWCRLI